MINELIDVPTTKYNIGDLQKSSRRCMLKGTNNSQQILKAVL